MPPVTHGLLSHAAAIPEAWLPVLPDVWAVLPDVWVVLPDAWVVLPDVPDEWLVLPEVPEWAALPGGLLVVRTLRAQQQSTTFFFTGIWVFG